MDLLLCNLVLTAALCGLIWTIQLVHYPLLAGFEATSFSSLHAAHTRRISWLVVPLMLTELAAAIAFTFLAPARLGPWPWVAAALLALVWISTFALQVPLHERLGAARDEVLLRRLVATNWIRTVAWTLRLALLAALCS